MIRIGVCGTGSVARGNYLPYLAKRKDVTVTVYNRTPAKAAACAEQFGATAVDSPAALVEAAPDGILVLTREMDRYEAAMALLEYRPKRLFFEKPLVARHDQAHVSEEDFSLGRGIIERAAARGCETAMVFNYRFFEQTKLARRVVEERGFGPVLQATALIHYATWSHCLDLAMLFTGPVRTLTALESPVERGGSGMTAPDVAAAFVCENGAAGTVIGTCGTDFRFPLFELYLSFQGGRIVMRGLDCDMDVFDHGNNRQERIGLPRDKSRWDQYSASFAKSLAAWLDSVRSGNPPPIPGLAGLRELQFEAALRRSAREHRPVSLADEFPLP